MSITASNLIRISRKLRVEEKTAPINERCWEEAPYVERASIKEVPIPWLRFVRHVG